jgi:hypothetical protein
MDKSDVLSTAASDDTNSMYAIYFAAAFHILRLPLSPAPAPFTPALRGAVLYAVVVIMGSLHHFNVRLSGT